jgi:hypothetical protein
MASSPIRLRALLDLGASTLQQPHFHYNPGFRSQLLMQKATFTSTYYPAAVPAPRESAINNETSGAAAMAT